MKILIFIHSVIAVSGRNPVLNQTSNLSGGSTAQGTQEFFVCFKLSTIFRNKSVNAGMIFTTLLQL